MARNVIDIVVKATNEARKGLTEPIKDLDDLQKKAEKIGPVFKAAAAGAVAAFGWMVKSSIDAADAVKQLSDRSGASAEFLSTMGYAAKQSDTSLESLGKGAKELNELLAAGNQELPEAAGLFKAYGIELKNTDGSLKSMEQVLPQVADLVAGAGSAAEKSAIAAQFFGKKIGPELVPLLNEGSAGLRDLQDEARALGLEISGDTATAAATFNDNLDKMLAAGQGVTNQFMSGFVPALANVTSALASVGTQGSIVKDVATGLGEVFKVAATAALFVYTGAQKVMNAVIALSVAADDAIHGRFDDAKDSLKALEGMNNETARRFEDAYAAIWAKPAAAAEEGAKRVSVANVKAIQDIAAEREKAAEKERRAQEQQAEEASRVIDGIKEEWQRLHLTKLEQLQVELDAEMAKLDEIIGRESEVEAARTQALENFAARKAELEAEEAERKLAVEAADAAAFEKQLAAAERLRQANEKAHQEQIDAIKNVVDHGGAMTTGLVKGMETFTDSSVHGSKKVEKAFENMWDGFKDALMRALIYKAAQEAVSWAVTLAAAKFGAAKLAAIWTPAATTATIATAGGAAVAAPVAIAGSLVATEGVMSAAVSKAHGGLDYVPREETFLLQKGERVVQPAQNVELTKFLEWWKAGGMKGGASQPSAVYLDGREVGKVLFDMGDDGRLTLPAKVIRG